MKKMRIFKFWNENGDEKEKEELSLKKEVMSVQGDYKDKVIGVSYTSKKRKLIETSVKIPMGRKIRQELIVEKIRRYNGEFKTYTILTKNNNFFVDGILVHSEINH